MPAELRLTINDAPDGPRQVAVPQGRFTIGRNAENDLVLNVPGLSRRHAVISNFGGDVRIFDCESQNGTFVNGQAVTTSAVLKDGDVLSLGMVCEITVHLEERDPAVGQTQFPSPPAAVRDSLVATSRADGALPSPSVPARTPASRNLPLISAALAAVIVLGTILVIVILRIKQDSRDETGNNRLVPATPSPIVTPTPSSPCEGLTVGQIERAAQQVIRRVSNDPVSYAFPPDRAPLDKIKETVERNCRSATLAEALQNLQRHRESLIIWSANQLKPDLLAYAALAETEGGAADPVRAAERIAPRLIDVWKILNDSHADSTLLFLAAFKMGGVGRGEHPIYGRMSKARLNPDTERNVWALYQKGGLTESEYDFVIKFLAFGILAQLQTTGR
jgi:hypothetical protein